MWQGIYFGDYSIFYDILFQFLIIRSPSPGGGGGISYESDGGDHWKFCREPLKGTRILFCGRGPYNFLPLRGTKSVH